MLSLPGSEGKELPEQFSGNDMEILFDTIENNLIKVDLYYESMNVQIIQDQPQSNVFEFASEVGKYYQHADRKKSQPMKII